MSNKDVDVYIGQHDKRKMSKRYMLDVVKIIIHPSRRQGKQLTCFLIHT